jgi:hypothetical protein
VTDNYDEGESWAEGDIAAADVNWNAVITLQSRFNEVLIIPEGPERSMAMLDLLFHLYGDELEVL